MLQFCGINLNNHISLRSVLHSILFDVFSFRFTFPLSIQAL